MFACEEIVKSHYNRDSTMTPPTYKQHVRKVVYLLAALHLSQGREKHLLCILNGCPQEASI